MAIPLEPFPLYDVYNVLLFHSHYFLYMCILGITDTRQKRYALKWWLLTLVDRRKAEWFTNSPILYCITGINLGVRTAKKFCYDFPQQNEVERKSAGPITGPSCLSLPPTTAHALNGRFPKHFFPNAQKRTNRDIVRTRAQIPQIHRTLFPLTLYGCEA
jgi:hypothetical protein